jgi:hypothetical protein
MYPMCNPKPFTFIRRKDEKDRFLNSDFGGAGAVARVFAAILPLYAVWLEISASGKRGIQSLPLG